jgi:hypothetical protein
MSARPNREPHLIAAHVDALRGLPFLEALQLRGWMDFDPQSWPRLANVISAIQPEAGDLPPHHAHQSLAQIERQSELPIWKFRYALAILTPDTEENMAQLFQIRESARGFIETFIFNGI